MRKMISILMALIMALLMAIPAVAEEALPEQDISGIWADPNHEKMELTILPSEVCWFDERMGTDAAASRYVVIMSWPETASMINIYQMIGTLDEAGKTLTYEGGLFGEYVFDENGELDEEDTGLLEDNGCGTFTLTENGVLLWNDSYLTESKDMRLERQIADAPSAEEIQQGYYQKVISLENGSAGSALKLAEAVCDVFQFCSAAPFWAMDAAYTSNLQAAQEALTAEEKASFDQNRGALTLEISRLLDEKEELGSAYADAGLEVQMNALRSDPAIRLSVEVFLFAVETLNAEP